MAIVVGRRYSVQKILDGIKERAQAQHSLRAHRHKLRCDQLEKIKKLGDFRTDIAAATEWALLFRDT